MISNSRLFFVLSLMLLVFGCAGQPVFKDPKDKSVSLVIMYIDMSEAPSNSEWVMSKMVRPKVSKPYYRFGFVKDPQIGYINHNQYIKPGIYTFSSFGGNAKNFLANARYNYNFPTQGRGMAVMKIKKQGVYFVGSFKYKKVKTKFFEQKKFEIQRTKSPTEKEVLTKFLGHMEEGKWKTLVQRRLARLK